MTDNNQNDKKPKWDHSIDIDKFEVLINNCVTKITHHWRMTSCDTSEDWVELHFSKGENKKSMRAPNGFDQYFKYSPNHCQLFQGNYNAEKATKDLEEIRKWEKRHAKEIAEYKRLKAKFETK